MPRVKSRKKKQSAKRKKGPKSSKKKTKTKQSSSKKTPLAKKGRKKRLQYGTLGTAAALTATGIYYLREREKVKAAKAAECKRQRELRIPKLREYFQSLKEDPQSNKNLLQEELWIAELDCVEKETVRELARQADVDPNVLEKALQQYWGVN